VSRGRLEAFSDGVLAVVITIMVLNLHPPAGHDLTDLRPLLPRLAVYLLSFVFIAIYWNNHHHLLQAVARVSGGVLLGKRAPAVLALAHPGGRRVVGATPR
jgi:uncharacterized membrane protein